ncbi:MAG: DUF6020 family protein [Lachnospiraceae bacterium]|jgi:hypothetical protein|nr:DUF6020 family protein [Lachnospiraceae bacterium]
MREGSGKGHTEVWEKVLYRDRKSWVRAAAFSFAFSFLFMLGRRLERYGSIPISDSSMWERIFLLWIFVTLCTGLFWSLLETVQEKNAGRAKSTGRSTGRLRHAGTLADSWDALPQMHRRLLVWGALLLVYLVALLAVRPGFFVYDASDELSMFESRAFTTHHPLVHVLLLGGTISLVRKITGSYNAGIFVYCLLQAAVLSAAFVQVLSFLKEKGAGRVLRFISFIFYGFFPVCVMFVLCTCKDTLFSAAMVMAILQLLKLFSDPGDFFATKKEPARFCFFISAMLLLRHNAVPAMLLFSLFLLFFLKGRRKQALLLCAIPFLCWGAVTFSLTAALHAQGGENQEVLTVPIQQLARCFVYEGDTFSPADRDAMDALMPEKDWMLYTPKVSDGVKIHFNNEVFEAHRQQYTDLWIRMGLAHPAVYLNAWFLTSYGFWYPDAVIDCYQGNAVFTFTYADSSYFGYETEKPGERQSLFPAVDAFFRWISLDPAVQTLPVVHLLFSPGAMFWFFAFVMVFCIDAGRLVPVRAFLPMFLTWLTTLLGPCSLPRYVVYLWFAFPLFLLFAFERADGSED